MFLALKEIRRSKLRFGLLMGAVGLLVFLMLFIQSLTSSLITQFIGALRNNSADVFVFGKDARKSVEGSVVTPEQLQGAIGIAQAAGFTAGRVGEGTFTVLVSGRPKNQDAVLFGYDLGGPGAPANLSKGRLPRADDEAVASSANTDAGFTVGATVNVEPGGRPITIVGLADDSNYSVSPTLFVSFPTYEAARRVRNPEAKDILASVVAIETGNRDASTVITQIDQNIQGVEALSRSDAANKSPGVSSVQLSLNSVVYVAGAIVVVVAGFFFVILTVQKSQALTLLRAIGASTASLVRSFLVQVVAVLGGGMVLAVLLLLVTRAAMSGSAVGVVIEPMSILLTCLVVAVMSVLASFGAIRRVLRIDPLRATVAGGVTG